MSLNRVASIETLADHHARRGSDTSIRPRKLSFNPLPQEWDPLQPNSKPGHHQPEQGGVSAFDVPQWKRIRMFTIPPIAHTSLILTSLASQSRSSQQSSTASSPPASSSA